MSVLYLQVVGKHGRGITELLDIPRGEIDLIVGSLEHSFATIGGFCAGTNFIVEHQRLSGLGKIYSVLFVYTNEILEEEPWTFKKTRQHIAEAL